ncbi:MAG: hypothetical protein ACRYHQ_31105 [Janthinobacterium lividum]
MRAVEPGADSSKPWRAMMVPAAGFCVPASTMVSAPCGRQPWAQMPASPRTVIGKVVAAAQGPTLDAEGMEVTDVALCPPEPVI